MRINCLSNISFRENASPVVGKTAVLPCSDEPTKKAFEQAITGVLGKTMCLFN